MSKFAGFVVALLIALLVGTSTHASAQIAFAKVQWDTTGVDSLTINSATKVTKWVSLDKVKWFSDGTDDADGAQAGWFLITSTLADTIWAVVQYKDVHGRIIPATVAATVVTLRTPSAFKIDPGYPAISARILFKDADVTSTASSASVMYHYVPFNPSGIK